MSLEGIQVDGTDAPETLIGTRRDDVISAEDGDDWIYSGMGDDFVFCGAGNDLVLVDLGDDVYVGGSGVDWVNFRVIDLSIEYDGDGNTFGVRFDLARQGLQDLGPLGRDAFYGFENIWGSLGNDRLYGDGSNNRIVGDDGKDLIVARNGNDTLEDGSGFNTFIGGGGMDRILLGGVADRLVYNRTNDSPWSNSLMDEIIYFYHVPDNKGTKINLRAIDADPDVQGNQSFTFVGQAAFREGRPGDVRFVKDGGDAYVYINLDDDKRPEMGMRIIDGGSMHSYDFYL